MPFSLRICFDLRVLYPPDAISPIRPIGKTDSRVMMAPSRLAYLLSSTCSAVYFYLSGNWQRRIGVRLRTCVLRRWKGRES